MAVIRQRLRKVYNQVQVAHFRTRQCQRERADLRAREHLVRLEAGIKDNLFGLNGR